MKNENATIIQTIATALAILPPDERKYIMGYAEGIIAMRTIQTAQNK